MLHIGQIKIDDTFPDYNCVLWGHKTYIYERGQKIDNMDLTKTLSK